MPRPRVMRSTAAPHRLTTGQLQHHSRTACCSESLRQLKNREHCTQSRKDSSCFQENSSTHCFVLRPRRATAWMLQHSYLQFCSLEAPGPKKDQGAACCRLLSQLLAGLGYHGFSEASRQLPCVSLYVASWRGGSHATPV